MMLKLSKVERHMCDICGQYDRDCICDEHYIMARYNPDEIEYYDADVEVLQR